jgi:hypothetical protein
MQTIKIGEKQYPVNFSYALLQWVFKKYNLQQMETWSQKQYDEYILDVLHKSLVSKYFLKPLTIWRMKTIISLKQMTKMRIDIQRLLIGQEMMSEEEFEKLYSDDLDSDDLEKASGVMKKEKK